MPPPTANPDRYQQHQRNLASAAAAHSNKVPLKREESEDKDECPLCMEELDNTDQSFKPCSCGYQVSVSD